MLCGQITLDALLGTNETNETIKQDIIHKDGKIYTDKPVNYLKEQEWMPNHTWPKKMKNGEVIYHHYHNDKHPTRETFTGRKRRFLFSIILDPGNPTWKSTEHFTEWLEAYENADTEQFKELVCNKFCKRCKKKKTQEKDIGEDAVTLSVRGYKS